MRKLYYCLSILFLLIIAALYPIWHGAVYWLIPVGLYILIGLYDILQHRHNILRNYPVIGHLRYMLEFVRPEVQQYFVATNLSGRPYNRETRDYVYCMSRNQGAELPFGTQHDLTDVGYESALHSMAPLVLTEKRSRVLIGGPDCKKPYLASRLNISGMSYGALGKTAVMALNKGAKLADCYQNTGEGGLTDYHLQGGDIVMQLGTGYFGARTEDGKLDDEEFKRKSNLDIVKMIEIKISQGAKPATGGFLPGAKVDEEIARFRGVPVGVDCISPAKHPEFSTPRELLQFVKRLRELSGGKPIGFKFCLGIRSEFLGICKAMLETKIYPDFITIDGAEGGTGSAYVEYSNSLGTPVNDAIVYVHNCLVGVNVRDHIKIIASGKVAKSFDMVTKIALGADLINVARPMLFALGCIQAVRCDTNTCPTGITTQQPWRVRALDPTVKSVRVGNYHRNIIYMFLRMVGAMGLNDPSELRPFHIHRRVADEVESDFSKIFDCLKPGQLLGDDIPDAYVKPWANANADHFYALQEDCRS